MVVEEQTTHKSCNPHTYESVEFEMIDEELQEANLICDVIGHYI